VARTSGLLTNLAISVSDSSLYEDVLSMLTVHQVYALSDITLRFMTSWVNFGLGVDPRAESETRRGQLLYQLTFEDFLSAHRANVQSPPTQVQE
jgi:hypothetical protein